MLDVQERLRRNLLTKSLLYHRVTFDSGAIAVGDLVLRLEKCAVFESKGVAGVSLTNCREVRAFSKAA
jgi:hypothetical protein